MPPAAGRGRRLPDQPLQAADRLLPLPPGRRQPLGLDPLLGERPLDVARQLPRGIPVIASGRHDRGREREGALSALQSGKSGTVSFSD